MEPAYVIWAFYQEATWAAGVWGTSTWQETLEQTWQLAYAGGVEGI